MFIINGVYVLIRYPLKDEMFRFPDEHKGWGGAVLVVRLFFFFFGLGSGGDAFYPHRVSGKCAVSITVCLVSLQRWRCFCTEARGVRGKLCGPVSPGFQQ